MTQPTAQDNFIGGLDRIYLFGMEFVKAARFGLLFTAALPKSGMLKGYNLAKVHQLATVAHLGFLSFDAARQAMAWQKSDSHGAIERFKEISEVMLFLSSASVMALAVHEKLRPFLNTDWKLQVQRLMFGSFIAGSGALVAHNVAQAAGFVDLRAGCPHKDKDGKLEHGHYNMAKCVEKQKSAARYFGVLGSLILFSYAAAEATAWVKGDNFRLFGKVDLWKVRTATGVLSGLGGMAVAVAG